MLLEIKNLLGGFLSMWNSNLHVLPEQRVIIEGMFLNYQIFKNTILWITNLYALGFTIKAWTHKLPFEYAKLIGLSSVLIIQYGLC